jgi:hypothetical protein
MAIDQRDVSSTLRFMDDRALQQYAAMHKSDPYIFPLAFQESQNRQRLRMQQQGAQGMQPQPKVADAALAQMAPPQAQPMPEDRGIGALPAPNMKFGAEGGIMGYDDDANFAERSEPVVMMAGGGVARYQSGGGTFAQMDQQKADQINQLNGQLAIIEPQLRAAAASGDQQAIQMYSQQAQAVRNQISAAREAAGNRVGVIDKLTAQPQQATSVPELNRSAINRSEQVARTNPAVYGAPAPAAPKADTTRRNKPAAETAPAAVTDPSAKPETGGLDTLMAEFTRKQDLARGASRNADVQYASSLRGEGAKLVADEEKRIKDQIDPYKDREARLLKQEKGLEGMGDKYLGLALLQAGAAMMTTPGNIGMALGKGVQVGSERYIQGMEKINAAKDKFADARDRLDDLRLNRSDMNARDIKAAKTEARTLERQAEALFYTGAKEDLKMTDKSLTTLLGLAADNLKTKDQQTFEEGQTTRKIAADLKNTMIREGGANARATMPTGADRTAMMLGTGKTDAERLESGMLKLQTITADKSGMAAVKVLADINAKRQPGEATVTMEDLLKDAREFSSLMYGPKVADVAPTRDRPR